MPSNPADNCKIKVAVRVRPFNRRGKKVEYFFFMAYQRKKFMWKSFISFPYEKKKIMLIKKIWNLWIDKNSLEKGKFYSHRIEWKGKYRKVQYKKKNHWFLLKEKRTKIKDCRCAGIQWLYEYYESYAVFTTFIWISSLFALFFLYIYDVSIIYNCKRLTMISCKDIHLMLKLQNAITEIVIQYRALVCVKYFDFHANHIKGDKKEEEFISEG